MLQRWRVRLSLFLGLALGVCASNFISVSWAARNSSGVYSLPTGNPVVSGTTITSANENAFRSDVATEFTDSLSRTGNGDMSVPLELVNGTVSAPGVSFASDADCGLYRIGANNVGLALNGAKVVDYATTGVAVTGTLSSTGVASGAGLSSSANLVFTGANPTDCSGACSGFSKTLTSANTPKAWAVLNGNGVSAASIVAGFNVTNLGIANTDDMTLDFITDFSSATAYGCTVTGLTGTIMGYQQTSAGTIVIEGTDHANASVNLNAGSFPITVVCYGAN